MEVIWKAPASREFNVHYRDRTHAHIFFCLFAREFIYLCSQPVNTGVIKSLNSLHHVFPLLSSFLLQQIDKHLVKSIRSGRLSIHFGFQMPHVALYPSRKIPRYGNQGENGLNVKSHKEVREIFHYFLSLTGIPIIDKIVSITAIRVSTRPTRASRQTIFLSKSFI